MILIKEIKSYPLGIINSHHFHTAYGVKIPLKLFYFNIFMYGAFLAQDIEIAIPKEGIFLCRNLKWYLNIFYTAQYEGGGLGFTRELSYFSFYTFVHIYFTYLL